MNYEKVAVHCPTEVLAKEVLTKAHCMGYKWRGCQSFLDETYWGCFKEETCYLIEKGEVGYLNWYKDEGYTIIPAEEFLNGGKKVYYRGNKERGAEIIKALKDLGATNTQNALGIFMDSVYFINKENDIDTIYLSHEWMLKELGYVEAHLPTKDETITVCGKTFIKNDFEKAINNLKEVKQ